MKHFVWQLFVLYYKAKGYMPLKLNGRPFLVDPYHTHRWRQMGKGSWEPHTFQIYDQYLQPHMTYADIGAWIGPTVLYASQKCATVYSFEPDFVAYQYLLWNIQLNHLKNVKPFNIALGQQTSLRTMASFGATPGDSMTSLLSPKEDETMIDVICMAWSEWLDLVKPHKIDFIKIDIEGGEFELLPTMQPYLAKERPILYLSVHGPYLPQAQKKERFQDLRNSLSMYSRCLNEKLESVSLDQLGTEDVETNLRAFLFLP